MKVRGKVARATGLSLSGYRVVVLHGDVKLKRERRLGTAKTDENGAFSLTVGGDPYLLRRVEAGASDRRWPHWRSVRAGGLLACGFCV
jgi:hypothetical protein